MALRVEVLVSIDELTRLCGEWDALAAHCQHPINSYSWCTNALRHVHRTSDRPHVLALWNGEHLEALAPLVLVKHSTGFRYEIIGARVLYEPIAILARTTDAARELGGALVKLRHPVVLTRLPAQSAFNEGFIGRARRAGILFNPRASGSQYVDLRRGWDPYYQGLPSRLKNIIRRGHKQLARIGEVSFEFIVAEPSNVAALLQQAFEVEARSWKSRTGSAVLLRPDLREFFFSYALDASRRGELLISFLRLQGAPVAMQIANIGYGAYWQLKLGYDECYSKQLVGLQLQLETIKWSYDRGLSRYEFLGVAERWIEEWTRTVHEYRTMHFYPCTFSGLRAALQDNIARVRDRLGRTLARPAQAANPQSE